MSVPNSDWLCCSTTQARMASVESVIASYIRPDDSNFQKLALHTVRKGGKKLRPSLYLLALNMGEYYDSGLLHPAAALELIHIASLHHDDVMDQAELRRNTISVNKAYGNLEATYSGNYLFSKAVYILSSYSKAINQLGCIYISDLCLGQLQEVENAYNLKLSIELHLEIISKKTASLFELPCKIGAILSNADSKTLQALTDYGRNVGIAFQLTDDCLDITGLTETMGKRKGTDLREGVYTYATLEALRLENGSGSLANILLQEELDDRDIDMATTLILKSGGLDKARKKAEAHIQRGIEALRTLPQGETRKSLENLAEYILARQL